jgi:hypothetical protein
MFTVLVAQVVDRSERESLASLLSEHADLLLHA